MVDYIDIDRTVEQLVEAIDLVEASSVAIGEDTEASGTTSVAVGKNSEATQAGTVAIGANSEASGVGAIALGEYSEAAKQSDTSVGKNSHAIGSGDSAFGSGATASGGVSISLGASSSSSGNLSSAIGTFSEASQSEAIAIGHLAKALAQRAVQIGQGTNSTPNTFKVGNVELLNSSGKIPFSALQGGEVVGLAVNSSNHLIVTYADGTTADLGVLGGGGTGNYNDLTNHPQVNGNTLTGNKTSAQLGLQSELVSGTTIKTINGVSLLGSGNISAGYPLVPNAFYNYTELMDIYNDDTNIPDGIYRIGQACSIDALMSDGETKNIMASAYDLFIIDRTALCIAFSGISDSLFLYTNDGENEYFEGGFNCTEDMVDKKIQDAVGNIDTALIGLISGGGVA